RVSLYNRYAHPTVLPPFPTRRSSDLAHFVPEGADQARGIYRSVQCRQVALGAAALMQGAREGDGGALAVILHRVVHVRPGAAVEDRKSTRLNSSHVKISYAVFCLKKK